MAAKSLWHVKVGDLILKHVIVSKVYNATVSQTSQCSLKGHLLDEDLKTKQYKAKQDKTKQKTRDCLEISSPGDDTR